jgi:hypothetical protein
MDFTKKYEREVFLSYLKNEFFKIGSFKQKKEDLDLKEFKLSYIKNITDL